MQTITLIGQLKLSMATYTTLIVHFRFSLFVAMIEVFTRLLHITLSLGEVKRRQPMH